MQKIKVPVKTKGKMRKAARRGGTLLTIRDSELRQEIRKDDRSEGARELTLDSKRYYRIGEVSRITGVKPYVLRYWEAEFKIMSPAKSRSKQRLYRKQDIENVLMIKKLLHEEKYTIAGARKRLKMLGPKKLRDQTQDQVTSGETISNQSIQLPLALDDSCQKELVRIKDELQRIRNLL